MKRMFNWKRFGWRVVLIPMVVIGMPLISIHAAYVELKRASKWWWCDMGSEWASIRRWWRDGRP